MDNLNFKIGKYELKYDKVRGYYHIFPVPSKEEVDKYYEEEFYGSDYDKQINDSSKEVQDDDLEFYNIQYGDIIETIKKEVIGKNILDIGCGYGKFLELCKKSDLEGKGCDPVREAVEVCKKNDLDVFKADIEDVSASLDKKFDIVVLLNVLEHLRDPKKTLEEIKDFILEDDGILVVRVPNELNKLQSIANKEYDLKNWWISAPQHINYFTVEHLEKLLKNMGYEVFLKETSFPLELFILMGDQYVGNSQIGKAIHRKRVRFEKIMNKYDNKFKRKMFQSFADLGIGRDVTFYCKKINK